MDAVEYLKQLKRMCKSFKECDKCPLYARRQCEVVEIRDQKMAVEIVEKWAKEHPPKTRQSEFQKHYPNVTLSHGIIYLCPKWVDENARVNCLENECRDCREQYWLEEIE